MQFGTQTLLPCSSWPWLGTQHEQVMSTKFQEELQRSHLKAQVPILEIGVYLNHIFIKYHIIILMYNMNITSEHVTSSGRSRTASLMPLVVKMSENYCRHFRIRSNLCPLPHDPIRYPI